jgi:hypothetical protein
MYGHCSFSIIRTDSWILEWTLSCNKSVSLYSSTQIITMVAVRWTGDDGIIISRSVGQAHARAFFLKGLIVHPHHSSQTPVPPLSFRGVRITETRFSFGYLIAESSTILKTICSVICSLFIDIRKPTKSNGLQVRQQCRRSASFIWDLMHLHISAMQSQFIRNY